MDNKQYSLGEALKVGPVLAAFFKTSCPVCQFTFPFLERFYRHFKETKARIWAVSQDDRRDTQEFIDEYGLTMPVLLEDVKHNYPTSNAYGLTHVPSIFLIGQNGEVLHSSVGFNKQDLIQIVELMVQQLNTHLAQRSITVTVTEEARKWILDQTVTDRSYGARPLRRALQKYIEDPMSEALIQGTFAQRPTFIEVYLDNNQLFYRPVGEEKTEGVLLYSN
jgi:peroxiredoxin